MYIYIYICIYIYIYIVPPLGAFMSQLGGTYILPLLFYMVNVYCDYTSIHIYIVTFHSSCLLMFLHVRCISHQNSQWLFWASVCVCVKCRFTMLYPYLSVLRRKTRWDDGRCPDCRPKFHIQFFDSRSLVTVWFVKSVHFFSNMGKKKVKPWSKNLPQRV